MLKLFTSPTVYFEQEFANIRLQKIGVIYGALVAVNFFFAFVVSLILGQGFVFALLSSVAAVLISPALYPVVFGGIAKLLFSKNNPSFTFRDGVKIAVSALTVTQVLGIFVSLLSLVLAFVSRGVVESATTSILLDETNAAAAAGSVAVVGILGLLVACVSLIGALWSFVLGVIGLMKVAKANTGMALVSAILTFIAMLVIGAIVGAIVTVISLPFAAAGSLTSLR